MTGHDDAMLDAVAVLALGALPAAEAREVAAHVATCETCRREYDELRGIANLVGYAAELSPTDVDEVTSARIKSRVMREIRATLPPPAAAPVPESAGVRAVPAPDAARPAGGRTPMWLAYGIAAAAVIVALIARGDVSNLRAQNDSYRSQVASLEARAQTQASAAAVAQARLAVLTAPDGKHYAVPGGDVITSGGRVYLALRNMQKPPAGKVYQAWTLAAGAKAVAPSITFAPDPSGITVIELPERASGLAAVAISVEPVGGSKAPTSKPAFVRPLS